MNVTKKKVIDDSVLMKEWDYEQNNKEGLDPAILSYGSNKPAHWICQKGHTFIQSIEKRTKRGYGCPYCSGKRILPGYNDLQTLNPALASEWNYGKNEGLQPNSISLHSNKSVWWKCSVCGHEWPAKINDRTNGRGCPICAKKKRIKSFREKNYLKRGVNDLQTLKPELLKEWDYNKNIGINPEDFTTNSNEQVWWICSVCGHKWQASIANRANKNSGCPKCMKHERTSFPEQALLYYIQMVYPSAINSYTELFSDATEYDIYIPEIKTAIEYDGKAFHSDNRSQKKAIQKYSVSKENGIRLIRVSELPSDYENSDLFIYREDLTSDGLNNSIHTVLNSLSEEEINVDVDRDRNIIHKRYISIIKSKSIAVRAPELVQEWDFTKNDDITPEMVNSLSNNKYWWICPNGHSYFAAPVSRTSGKTGCPYCSNHKVLSGFNDLATKYPDIAKEWDYEKNNGITPDQVLPGSQKYYYWKCNKGHSFEMTPNQRTSSNSSCPYCSGHRVLKGFNDITTTNPEVLEIWDYEKNTQDPQTLSSGSNVIVWWKCQNGHHWQKRIVSQLKHNYCPICSCKKMVTGVNDLATTNPGLLNEWNYEKNTTVNPTTITRLYDKKVWWKCSTCGHEWQTTIAIRLKGSGCPECGYSVKMQSTIIKNARIKGNDLQTKFPKIASEWDYETNKPLTPYDVTYGSNKKVWWICPICGNSYQAWISDRTGKKKTSCPSCSHKKTQKRIPE